MSLQDSYAQLLPSRLISGTLFMTNYRVCFIPSPSQMANLAQTNPSVYTWLNVPLACIDKVEKERRSKDVRTR